MKTLASVTGTIGLAAIAAAATPENPSLDGANYIAVGPVYQTLSYKINGVKADKNLGDVTRLLGLSFDYGRYFGRSSIGVHEAGVTFTGMSGDNTYAGNKVTLTEGVLSAFYNYNFQVGQKTLIYVGPRLGVAAFDAELDFAGGGSGSGDGATTRFGIGVGVKQKFTETFGMTLGLEHAAYADFDMDYDSGFTGKVTDASSTKVTLSFAWNF